MAEDLNYKFGEKVSVIVIQMEVLMWFGYEHWLKNTAGTHSSANKLHVITDNSKGVQLHSNYSDITSMKIILPKQLLFHGIS